MLFIQERESQIYESFTIQFHQFKHCLIFVIIYLYIYYYIYILLLYILLLFYDPVMYLHVCQHVVPWAGNLLFHIDTDRFKTTACSYLHTALYTLH